MRPHWTLNPMQYRGRDGWHIGGRAGARESIHVEGTRDVAVTLRDALIAARDGHINDDELTAYERVAFGMEG